MGGQCPCWRSLHIGVTYTSLADGSERLIVMGGYQEHIKIFGGSVKPLNMVGYSLNLHTLKWQRGSRPRPKTGVIDTRPKNRFLPQPRICFAAEQYGCHLL